MRKRDLDPRAQRSGLPIEVWRSWRIGAGKKKGGRQRIKKDEWRVGKITGQKVNKKQELRRAGCHWKLRKENKIGEGGAQRKKR